MATERQQRLLDSAKEFMKEFSIEYLKMYGLAMFTKIKDEMAGEAAETKLQYRDWKSIERPDVFRGECFMRAGEGAGAFGAWKKVYLVEMRDYNLAVYNDEKSYQAKKKPKLVIRTAGYTVQSDPVDFYKTELHDVAGWLGLTEEETNKMTQFSPYSWALAHRWRTNYIFQLHSSGGGGGACACFGGGSVEPEDAGAEFSDKRDEYIKVFEKCTVYGKPRDLNSISGKTFDLTVAKLVSKFSNLSDFTDEGYESEILVDMLLEECLMPLREEMIGDLKGPTSMKLLLWNKTRGLMQKALQGIATPVWSTTQKAAQALGEKIEPGIRKGIEPILRVKDEIKQKIREKVIDKMGSFLQKYVTPHIDPILKAFDKPMTKGFDYAKKVFDQRVDISSLADDPQQRNLHLDEIPRNSSYISEIVGAADELIQPISDLKNISGDVFAEVDPAELRSRALLALFCTLDAAVYTLECRLDESGKSEDLKMQILQDYDHDVMVMRATFVKDVVRGLLINGFKKAIGPAVDPVIESLDAAIPEDVQDFISVAAVFEEIVDMFVGEPIDKMVEGAYPKPKK